MKKAVVGEVKNELHLERLSYCCAEPHLNVHTLRFSCTVTASNDYFYCETKLIGVVDLT